MNLVVYILNSALPEEAHKYTLTGTSFKVTNKNPNTRKDRDYEKIDDLAYKLPDELNMSIRRLILESDILKLETGILQRFDAWMNLVYTKAFNRIRDLKLKHWKKDVAKKLKKNEETK